MRPTTGNGVGAGGVADRVPTGSGADTDRRRTGGVRRGQNHRRRGDRGNPGAHRIGRLPVDGEVALGQPDAVEPLRLRDLGDRHRLGKRLFLRSPFSMVALHYQADVHMGLPRTAGTSRSPPDYTARSGPTVSSGGDTWTSSTRFARSWRCAAIRTNRFRKRWSGGSSSPDGSPAAG